MKEKGQVLIILILVTLVALTVGLAITQRSVTDISISTKTEQSSRAFSAAEAGIEKAIEYDQNPAILLPTDMPLDLGNESSVLVSPSGGLPLPTQALEYPKMGKSEFAHFWLANPEGNLLNPSDTYFNRTKLSVYFGNSPSDPSDLPAIEVNVVSLIAGEFRSTRFFYDSNVSRSGRAGSKNNTNGFDNRDSGTVFCDDPLKTDAYTSFSRKTDGTKDRHFLCRADVSPVAGKPVLARVRVLYSTKKQAVALGPPMPECENQTIQACNLPPVAALYTSTGTSGQTQRRLKVLRVKNVVPFYFDYAIFSDSPINK